MNTKPGKASHAADSLVAGVMSAMHKGWFLQYDIDPDQPFQAYVSKIIHVDPPCFYAAVSPLSEVQFLIPAAQMTVSEAQEFLHGPASTWREKAQAFVNEFNRRYSQALHS